MCSGGDGDTGPEGLLRGCVLGLARKLKSIFGMLANRVGGYRWAKAWNPSGSRRENGELDPRAIASPEDGKFIGADRVFRTGQGVSGS